MVLEAKLAMEESLDDNEERVAEVRTKEERAKQGRPISPSCRTERQTVQSGVALDRVRGGSRGRRPSPQIPHGALASHRVAPGARPAEAWLWTAAAVHRQCGRRRPSQPADPKTAVKFQLRNRPKTGVAFFGPRVRCIGRRPQVRKKMPKKIKKKRLIQLEDGSDAGQWENK